MRKQGHLHCMSLEISLMILELVFIVFFLLEGYLYTCLTGPGENQRNSLV